MVHPNAFINIGKGASKSILAFFDDVVWLYKNTGLVWFIPMHVSISVKVTHMQINLGRGDPHFDERFNLFW